MKAGLVVWFEQVVHGVNFKRFDGILVIGSHKNHDRHPLRTYRLKNLESIKLRHLDIQKDELRRRFDNRVYRLATVGTFADDSDSWMIFQQGANSPAGQRLIINNERFNGIVH